jgi:RNA polymerase sigma-70 factor (ECF subfamily)
MHGNYSEEKIIELIDKARLGESKAFELVVRTYQKYAFSVAFKILCNEEDVKDVVQECFIRIWRHISKYDKKIKFTTWMYKMVVNLCYDKIKARKRTENKMVEINDEKVEQLLLSVDNTERELSNNEIAEKIKLISENLPAKQKMIFVLRDLQDLSINEVVQITGMSESSVKTNLVYARRSVKEKLIRWMK